jgi:hypothetical protein
VQSPAALEMVLQRRRKAPAQHGDPILAALRPPDSDLPRLEVQVLDPQLQRLEQPEPAAIEQQRHQPRRARQPAEQPAHLFAREDDRQPLDPLRPGDVRHPDLPAQHHPIQEEQGAQRLRLAAPRQLPPLRQVAEELLDLGGAQLRRVAEPVEATNRRIRRRRLLRPAAELPEADGPAELRHQLR